MKRKSGFERILCVCVIIKKRLIIDRDKVSSVLRGGIFQFGCGRLRLLVVVDVLGHLPDLHDVVLRDGADDPGFIGVPRKVRNLGRMTSVNELKSRQNIKKLNLKRVRWV